MVIYYYYYYYYSNNMWNLASSPLSIRTLKLIPITFQTIIIIDKPLLVPFGLRSLFSHPFN